MRFKEVLSVKEVAEYLGISESVVRRLIREHRIPFFRIERRVLFLLPAIRDWLNDQLIQPDSLNRDSLQINKQETKNRIWNKIRGY